MSNKAFIIVWIPSTSSPQFTSIASKSSTGISICNNCFTNNDASSLPLSSKIFRDKNKSKNSLNNSLAPSNNTSFSSSSTLSALKSTTISNIFNNVLISCDNSAPVIPSKWVFWVSCNHNDWTLNISAHSAGMIPFSTAIWL